MKERLKQLRKELKLNQESFGQRVSLSRTAVANMEIGRRTITDRTIQLICSAFNVNEDWLRHDTGEMFNTSNDLIELFGYAFNDLDEEESQFLKNFLSLSKEERQATLKYMRNLFKNFSN